MWTQHWKLKDIVVLTLHEKLEKDKILKINVNVVEMF